MKSIKYLVVFAIAIIFSLSSCTKDNSIIDITDPKPVTPIQTSSNPLVTRGTTGEEGLDMGCFTVKFPFELSVNGTVVSINSEDDFNSAFDNLIQEDSLIIDSAFVDFVYPLEITYNDSGNIETINDGQSLGTAFANCVPDTGWVDNFFPAFLIDEENSCFVLNYPVKLSSQDSLEYTANDENEFIDLIAQHEFLSFVFPISITNIKTQETVEAQSSDMLFDLLMSCDPDIDPDTVFNPGCFGVQIACYTLGFPVTYTDQDGQTVTANNIDELTQAYLSGKVVEITFPMNLVSQDSIVTTVGSEEELNQAIEACGNLFEGVDADLMPIYMMSTASNCYRIVYPITITSDGGETTSVLANEDELISELYNDISSEIVYPFTLFDINANENKVFENSDDLYGFLSQCE